MSIDAQGLVDAELKMVFESKQMAASAEQITIPVDLITKIEGMMDALGNGLAPNDDMKSLTIYLCNISDQDATILMAEATRLEKSLLSIFVQTVRLTGKLLKIARG